MKVLLLSDVRKLGHLGDVVDVTPGYARNYLVPQRLATEPTDENIKSIEDARKHAAAQRAARLKEFEALVAQLKDVQVTIEAVANNEGTLYGSVGAKDIAAAMQTQGYPVLTEHVMLDRPIRTLDNRTIRLEFTDELSTSVKLWVVRAGGSLDDEAGESEQQPAATASDDAK